MKNTFRVMSYAFLFSAAVLLSACCSHCETQQKPSVIVPTLTTEQKAYLATPRAERVAKFADKKFRTNMVKQGYYPQGYTIALPESGSKIVLKELCKPAAGLLDKNVPSTPKTVKNVTVPPYIRVDFKKGKLCFSNLKIATKYSLAISAKNGKTTETIFATEDIAPRLVRIDGIPNVRDLGGRMTSYGKRVRQGLIYRTAGLNDNAHRKYNRQAALKKNPALAEQEKAILREIRKWEGYKKNPASLKLVEIMPDSNWTMFLTAKKQYAAGNKKVETIPAVFCGAKAQKIKMDKSGKWIMPPRMGEGPAVFMKVIDTQEDAVLHMTAGADWFWMLTCNGKKIADFLLNGNGKPVSASNYHFAIPLKKGKNLLIATVNSGSDGCSWCCKFLGKKEQLIDYVIKDKKAQQRDIFRVITPGRNRFTKASLTYTLNDLGLRSDVDLRSDGECYGMTGSPAGKTVTWFHYSSAAYAGMASKGGKYAFANVFRVFLDEKNYPIAFHCIAGQDRTGAVACILNGLLGVPEEELYRDWESTGFWNRSHSFNHKNLFNKLIAVFQAYPGKTLNEKIEAYVISCGFTKADIEKFRKMML